MTSQLWNIALKKALNKSNNMSLNQILLKAKREYSQKKRDKGIPNISSLSRTNSKRIKSNHKKSKRKNLKHKK